MRISIITFATLIAGLLPAQSQADNIYGLKPGKPELQSISAITFGPDGILFIGDSRSATIVAIETQDAATGESLPEEVPAIAEKLAEAFQAKANEVKVIDLAVNPETKNVFLAAQVEGHAPRLFQVSGGEQALIELDLNNVLYAVVALPNPAEDKEVMVGNRKRNNRLNAVTDLVFANGQLLVAGLSNDKAASNVWSLKFPFQEIDHGTPLEFYHGAHGRSEDYAPIRTFVPFIVDGEPNLLAGFVCTPLVKFPLSQLNSGESQPEKARGTTVAELGNRNQPLDMIAYKQDGADYLLLSNSERGVMKISTSGIAQAEGITQPVPDGKTSGQSFERITELDGTIQLDKLNDTQAVVIIQKENIPATLKVIQLP